MPTTRCSSSITGSALILFVSSRRATSATLVSGAPVMTFLVMIAATFFIGDPSRELSALVRFGFLVLEDFIDPGHGATRRAFQLGADLTPSTRIAALAREYRATAGFRRDRGIAAPSAHNSLIWLAPRGAFPLSRPSRVPR